MGSKTNHPHSRGSSLRSIGLITGLVLNIAGAIVITLGTYFIATAVFDIHLNQFPAWAVPH